MKTSKRNKLLGLALTGSFSLFGASNALAAAGDNISNFATLQYSVGTTPQTVIESGSGTGNSVPGAGYATANGLTTDFTEDRLINFTVNEVGGVTTTVNADATLQVQEFLITNDGNGNQDFLFTALNRITGTADPHGGTSLDSFDALSVQVFVETANPGFDPADDTAIFADEIAPLGTATVYIVSTIPDSTVVSNGDIAVMSLVAQVAADGAVGVEGAAINNDDNGNISPAGTYSNGGTAVALGTANDVGDIATGVGSEQNVFNDPAGTLNSAGVADIVRNGQHSADDTYTVAAAALTVTKTSIALYDPINIASNPKSIPGGYVTYTVSVANAAGAADAALTTLTDILPATLVLDPNFVLNDGSTPTSGTAGESIEVVKGATTIYCTAAADGDGCDYTGGAGGTVTVTLTNAIFAAIMPLAATETVTIKFNAIVQ